MAGAIDIKTLEKELASKTTSALKSALKSAIAQTTNAKSGLAQKQATSGAVFKFDRLQRITIKAPHYIFKQNYGFEGTKSNGITMRLKATEVVEQAINTGAILENLADGISEIRLSQVAAIINFGKNGR